MAQAEKDKMFSGDIYLRILILGLPVPSLASGAATPRVVKVFFVNMACTLKVFWGGRVRAAVARCGFATRGVTIPGSISREPDPDFDWEPEERELQEVERYRLLPGPSA